MSGTTTTLPENTIQPMNALLRLAFFAAEQLLAHAPELFARFIAALNKSNVTVEDLQQERSEIAVQHYKDFVPATQIPPEEQT